MSCEHCGLQFYLDFVEIMHIDQDIPSIKNLKSGQEQSYSFKQ